MKTSAVAIVGMACRFPGARNPEELWANLRAGREAIRSLSEEEMLAAGVTREELANPDYVRTAAILGDIDRFDAPLFGFSPRDAAIMEPQQRHFLECAWEALEHAGHAPETFAGAIGVFAGSGMNGYLIHNLLANRALTESAGLFLLKQTGNDKDLLATRVSYHLDLHGPSLSVQTACSTSLVAVHLACQSLLQGECDMALAGGVTIEIPHGRGYLFREGEILSRDGHCRAFDAASSGTVFSSGAGIVVLRRLEDALAGGDTIHAIILGSAINNDGARKIGFLAPSVDGQAEVVAEALAMAGLGAGDISYVETHGTGTTVGDPIEIKALTQAFRQTTQRCGYCAIGSLKTNLGHMDAAAGIGGLIKTVLALKHRALPASLHFRTPNPQIRFEETPFFVNAELRAWQSDGPRRAGVTGLGIGGTNVHVVLEEAPPVPTAPSAKPFQILALSAKTESSLTRAAANLAGALEAPAQEPLADIAFTLQTGRKPLASRQAVVAASAADAAAALRSGDPKRVLRGTAPRIPPRTIFLFSGQGSQYVNMGADLYASEGVFRSAFDRCAELLRPRLGLDLRPLVYPPEAEAASAEARLNQTALAQPALFAVDYALAQFWLSCGVEPQAMLGHSFGEYVAACLAGVFSLEDALAIAACRGALMQQMAPGAMLTIPLAPEEIELGPPLSLAAINGPRLCVVSGPFEAIEAIAAKYAAREIHCRRLHVSHAMHSATMEPMLEPFRERLRTVAFQPPRIPYLSNLTGGWITPEQATSPDYWTRHIRQTVRFSENLADAFRFAAEGPAPVNGRPQSPGILLEVGPGQALASLARQHTARGPARVLTSMRHPQEPVADSQYLLTTVAQLWTSGQPIRWEALHAGEQRRRVPLPTYPFEHQRYWISPDAPAAHAAAPALQESQHEAMPAASALAAATSPAPSRASSNPPGPAAAQDEIASWLQRLVWIQKEAPPPAGSAGPANWLVFDDETGIAKSLIARLLQEGQRVSRVLPRQQYARNGAGEYTIRADARADYDALLADLERQGETPRNIAHLWPARIAKHELKAGARSALLHAKRNRNGGTPLDSNLSFCFYSPLYLAQAIADREWPACNLGIVSRGLHVITASASETAAPAANPIQSVLLGPVRVIPHEVPEISCRNIDVELVAPPEEAARVVWAEMSSSAVEAVVAYRGAVRWTESFVQLGADPAPQTPSPGGPVSRSLSLGRLREQGVYLITGGLGGIGLALGEHLAHACKAKLVFVTRSGDRKGESALRLKASLKAIASAGGEALIVEADVTRRDQLHRALLETRRRFGAIHGVIHAAGVLEDAPLRLKSYDSAARVLAPKVHGTVLLEEELRGKPLDFLALFSSVSSLTPPAGQVDYAAANAFLDAFAQSRRHRPADSLPDTPIVAINWGLWQDVGMGARALRGNLESPRMPVGVRDRGSKLDHNPTPPGTPRALAFWGRIGRASENGSGRATALHPLLARRVAETPAETLFAANLPWDEHWVLSEHGVRSASSAQMECGLLPGTGYLEMAAAAFGRTRPGSDAGGGPRRAGLTAALEFKDVFFLSPLACVRGGAADVRVRLRPEGSAMRFSILSRSAEWTENAVGSIAYAQPPGDRGPAPVNGRLLPAAALEIATIRARCPRELHFDEFNRTRQERYLAFGPRWRCLRSLHLGDHEALARIELPETCAGDLPQYMLHPALLDMATGAALYTIAGYEASDALYLPLAYKRFLLYDALPSRFVSYIRARPSTADNPIASFDVTLLDPSGRVLAEIEEFSARRLANPAGLLETLRAVPAPSAADPAPAIPDEPYAARAVNGASVDPPAIPPQLGARAFVRAISASAYGQIIIAPQRLVASRRPLGAQPLSPAMSPSCEVEQVLAGWWQELLGVEHVGLDDDFFDLGGYSLIAVSLFGKIKKTYRLDLALSTLFEARTIRQLAKLIPQAQKPVAPAAASWSALVPMQKAGWRPPLFMISGSGGNVLNFCRLASLLGSSQPVYALQPQGLDGRKPFLTRVEDMAANYIAEIKTLQPAGPYCLAGYSFGGIVAYEMAQQMLAAGESVAFLGLVDAIEWGYLELVRRSLRPAQRIALYKERFENVFFKADGWRYLRKRLRAYTASGIYRLWHGLGGSAPQRIGTIEDCNLFAASIYNPKPYSGPVTIFRCMRRDVLDGSDERLGWGVFATGPIEVHDVPGTHFDMTREPHVHILAAKVRQSLARAALASHTAAAAAPQTSSSGVEREPASLAS